MVKNTNTSILDDAMLASEQLSFHRGCALWELAQYTQAPASRRQGHLDSAARHLRREVELGEVESGSPGSTDLARAVAEQMMWVPGQAVMCAAGSSAHEALALVESMLADVQTHKPAAKPRTKQPTSKTKRARDKKPTNEPSPEPDTDTADPQSEAPAPAPEAEPEDLPRADFSDNDF